MPICCRCNGSGSCKKCSCKKAKRSCSDCLPHRRGHCTNSDQQLSRPSTDSTPVPGQTLPPSFTNEPPSSPPAEIVETPQHAETRVSLTPDLAAIDVMEIKHGSFSPLVFTTSGGMGTTATVVYKRLASLIAEKHDTSYHRTIHWLRCNLSFSLLRSAIMCLRGSRSTVNHPARPSITGDNIDLACSEGQVPE